MRQIPKFNFFCTIFEKTPLYISRRYFFEKYEIIKFKNEKISLDVRIEPNQDTVWLSKDDIALLFNRDRTGISKHIKNIFSERELYEKSSCAKNARQVNGQVHHIDYFKNKRTRYHTSIEISVLEDGIWENIKITDSPTIKGDYVEFDVNPNPNSNEKSYFRKYLRKDKLRHKGEELKKYRLVVSDEIKINIYVSLIKEKRKKWWKAN